MNRTPNANRKHICIYGYRNAGKSTLMNRIIGQDISLVSDIMGTTTDPVSKAMELIPLGPVVFMDTAGIDDQGELGQLRVDRAYKMLQRTDFAIYVIDATDSDFFTKDKSSYNNIMKQFKRFSIPYILIFNKIDLVSDNIIFNLKEKFQDALFITTNSFEDILRVKNEIINRMSDDTTNQKLIADIVPYGSNIIMVVPIDSEAPKGRIILPQVQLIRDCLDGGIKCHVVRDTELAEVLTEIKNIDLVITDSQAFKEVNKIVHDKISLTSFSIIMARHKGDLKTFIDGANTIKNLKKGSKILISESCTHNVSHEDIGRIKIPKLLDNYLGYELNYNFRMGHDFPKDLETYDLVIHCGSCMINKKTMLTRIKMCKELNIPITNYGVVLALVNNILKRSTEIFKNHK